MNQKLFAFWEYSSYPYVLGAEIENMLPDGFINAKGYGGYSFKPIKILPLKEGKELKVKLDNLKEEYDKAEKDLRKVYNKKLMEVADFIKK